MVLGVLFAFSLFNHNHSFLSLTYSLLLSDPQFSLGCQEWHQGAMAEGAWMESWAAEFMSKPCSSPDV